ncbi:MULTISPECIES: hypothetical protein [Mesonia]|uniref:hypothetical protein n=1 Tax=Mesonia TaxID=232115 RepID=UPI000C459461|nr:MULTISPECIES: hypothetical protein [Mesonia]MAN28575.1 hypothetical protein [Mesonia sp.]MAQ41256.1 hypothetical protein [Mesonia sp.]MBJ97355.1 hypothetical protein [Flavobacteriaceae bacterium]
MKIEFLTKEESNRQQQEEFLKLSPAERFYAFLDLSYRLKDFPHQENKKPPSDNFVIEIKYE